MNEFKRFVEWAGGVEKAAELLQCKTQLVQKVMSGKRGVSKENARRILEVGGRRFSLSKLLFGDIAA